jgi:hypothetical protein
MSPDNFQVGQIKHLQFQACAVQTYAFATSLVIVTNWARVGAAARGTLIALI